MSTMRPAAIGGVCAFIGMATGWCAADQPSPVWVPLVKVAEFTMREARAGAAAVVNDDAIYVIGGSDGLEPRLSEARLLQLRKPEDALNRTRDSGLQLPTISDTVERIDLRSGESTMFAKLGQPRAWHSAVRNGDQIYIIGGYSPHSEKEPLEKTVEILNLATGEMTSGPADQPDPRSHFGCVLLDGKVYVIGGIHLTRQRIARTNTVEILELATGTWSRGPPMPTPRQCVAAVVEGGFIVVPGGYDGKRSLTAVEVFDPRARAWRKLPPLSRETSAHSLAFLGFRLFLFGGYRADSTMLGYNLFSKTSEIFKLGVNIARHGTAVVHAGRIYVIGGKDPGDTRASDRIHVFELQDATPNAPVNG